VAKEFTSQQAVDLTGVTPRQLQWWDERGLVVASRSGRNRMYSLDDVAELAVVGQLRSRGLSLQRVRKVVQFLQRELGKRLVETVTSGSDWHLLTDGRQVFLKNSAEQVIEVLKNSRQPLFAICLSDTVRQVRAELRGIAGPLPPHAPKGAVPGPLPRGAQTRRASRASLGSRPGAPASAQAKPQRAPSGSHAAPAPRNRRAS
jgi:DNA-binding transcriptional MerR regulator